MVVADAIGGAASAGEASGRPRSEGHPGSAHESVLARVSTTVHAALGPCTNGGAAASGGLWSIDLLPKATI